MAYYEMMPAGLPAGLQSGMDSVLNKKFGTATSYAPGTWPDTVNLMGPLPEATATGSIAHITDGADEVPLKSWEVTLPASLDGYSAIGCNEGGANFIELYTRASHNGIDYSINADGSLHRDGTASGNSFNNPNATNYGNCPYKFKKGTYTITVSGSTTESDYVSFGIITKSGTSMSAQNVYGNSSKTFTINEDFGAWFYIKTNSGVTVDDNVYIWVSAGSTADEYSKYTAPTTATVSLGRTIYGGTADVVKGTCSKAITETKTFDGSDDENWLYSSSYGWFYIDNQFGDAYRNNAEDDFMGCNLGTQTKYSSVTTLPDMHFACTSGTNSRFAFKNTQYSTVEAFKEWLSNNNMIVAYTSATFTPFTFTPITPTPETALGVNNFWADEGDSEVTYRRDIDLALQALSGSRGLMMARPQLEPETEPEETIEETPEEMER